MRKIISDPKQPQQKQRTNKDQPGQSTRRPTETDTVTTGRKYGDSDTISTGRRFGDTDTVITGRRFGDSDNITEGRRFGDNDNVTGGRRFGDNDSQIKSYDNGNDATLKHENDPLRSRDNEPFQPQNEYNINDPQRRPVKTNHGNEGNLGSRNPYAPVGGSDSMGPRSGLNPSETVHKPRDVTDDPVIQALRKKQAENERENARDNKVTDTSTQDTSMQDTDSTQLFLDSGRGGGYGAGAGATPSWARPVQWEGGSTEGHQARQATQWEGGRQQDPRNNQGIDTRGWTRVALPGGGTYLARPRDTPDAQPQNREGTGQNNVGRDPYRDPNDPSITGRPYPIKAEPPTTAPKHESQEPGYVRPEYVRPEQNDTRDSGTKKKDYRNDQGFDMRNFERGTDFYGNQAYVRSGPDRTQEFINPGRQYGDPRYQQVTDGIERRPEVPTTAPKHESQEPGYQRPEYVRPEQGGNGDSSLKKKDHRNDQGFDMRNFERGTDYYGNQGYVRSGSDRTQEFVNPGRQYGDPRYGQPQDGIERRPEVPAGVPFAQGRGQDGHNGDNDRMAPGQNEAGLFSWETPTTNKDDKGGASGYRRQHGGDDGAEPESD